MKLFNLILTVSLLLIAQASLANDEEGLCTKENVVTLCQKVTTPAQALKCADDKIKLMDAAKLCGLDCVKRLRYCTTNETINLTETFTSN